MYGDWHHRSCKYIDCAKLASFHNAGSQRNVDIKLSIRTGNPPNTSALYVAFILYVKRKKQLVVLLYMSGIAAQTDTTGTNFGPCSLNFRRYAVFV